MARRKSSESDCGKGGGRKEAERQARKGVGGERGENAATFSKKKNQGGGEKKRNALEEGSSRKGGEGGDSLTLTLNTGKRGAYVPISEKREKKSADEKPATC